MKMSEKELMDKLESMYNGMIYHCREMMELLKEHMNDPFFETEFGKKMEKSMLGIVTNHTSGLVKIMGKKFEKESKKDPEDFETSMLESVFKSME